MKDWGMPLKPGSPLRIRRREVPFSFFPVRRKGKRNELADVLFASDPWAVMRNSAHTSKYLTSTPSTSPGVAKRKARFLEETLAYLEQAEAFHASAQGRRAADPLLHYYSILNVGKALLRIKGFRKPLEHATHGLGDASAGATDPRTALIKVQSPGGSRPRVFGEVIDKIGYPSPIAPAGYRVSELMAQVVIGHRLWRDATGAGERFLVAENIQFMEDKRAKKIWLRIYLDSASMKRHGITQKRLLDESGLGDRFSLHPVQEDGRRQLCLEQNEPLRYSREPAPKVIPLVNGVRPHLWRIVSALPGSSYRRYYLNLVPNRTARLSQLEAVWAFMYYLGSVVRYRPHRFDDLANGRYGPFVEEFITVQIEQLLYLFASEMCQREIAKPAIV